MRKRNPTITKRQRRRQQRRAKKPVVEVGFGSGTMLIRMALANPKRKYIGIETEDHYEMRLESLEKNLREVTGGKIEKIGNIKNLEILFLEQGAAEKLEKMADNSVGIFNAHYVFDNMGLWGRREILLKEIARTLSPYGTFYATIPLDRGAKGEIHGESSVEKYNGTKWHLARHFEIKEERFLRPEEHKTKTQRFLFDPQEQNPRTAYLFVCRKKRRK